MAIIPAKSATNYNVNYDDKRFAEVETDKNAALSELEKTYAGMINSSDAYYNAQINASKEWADKQSQLQQEQTDFAIEKIEQEKDKAQKDYTKEQSGAYVDWRKQSNEYGTEAEKMAAAGLQNTGFSESSQVSMYNTYQNRVASAREVFNLAVLNYNNAIKEARLQNNSILAEIAYEALQKQLELSLQGFQYKNQLILDKANKKLEVENTYYDRYQDVLEQINTENAMKEEVRQFNANYDLKIKEYNEGIRQFNEELARLKAKDKQEYELEIKQLELEKKHMEEEKRQFEAQMAEEQRQFNAQMSKSSGSSSSGGSTKITGSSGSGGGTKLSGGGTSYAVNTAYYQGDLNPDANKYGTFDNGYQPKGISGHGALSKTGQTIQLSTQTLSGQKQTVVQNVWKAADGSLWYWEGRQNKYIMIRGAGSSNDSRAGGGGRSLNQASRANK